jgi:hypothetical protein
LTFRGFSQKHPCCHRVFEQVAPFFSAAAHPEFFKREAKIVLGHGPRVRQIGPGIDLEGGAISGYRVFEQFVPFFCAAPLWFKARSTKGLAYLSRTFLNAGRICEGETLALPSSLITRITSNRLAVSCPDNLIFPSAK